MDLKELYSQVRLNIQNALPEWWPGLGEVLGSLIKAVPPPEAVLPLAACMAVGGLPANAVSVSAAFLTLGMSVRIFDDLFDKDKEAYASMSQDRVCNYAATIQNAAYSIINRGAFDLQLKERLNACLIEAFFAVAAGQDRDIAGIMTTPEEYWLTVELKSASIYAAACQAGAMAGKADQAQLEACRAFGRNLGRSIQVLNDMDSIWNPKGKSDLDLNKVTLPVLYGLSLEHSAKQELAGIVNAGRLAAEKERVVHILDSINAREYLVWTALQERDQALKALELLPDVEGRDLLYAYITGIFGDTGEAG